MNIDAAIVVLYRQLMPGEVDATQLGDPGHFSGTPENALTDINAMILANDDQVDLNSRPGRYLASLALTLGIRIGDPALGPQLDQLASVILQQNPDVLGDAAGVAALRSGLERLFAVEPPEITQDVVNDLVSAYNNVLDVSFDSGTGLWDFKGPCAESASMLVELMSMGLNCQCENGFVMLNGVRVPVLSCRFEICTQLPWERCKPGVDPRNWPDYSPLFFDKVTVIGGSPSTGNWQGIIQEEVGALLTSGTGAAYTTNLLVSYLEDQDMAVTAYDIAPDSPSIVPGDDGKIDVDYGFFSVTNEGTHRRMTVLKVVHIKGKDDFKMPNWICPLLQMQLVMIGWWFPDAA